MDPKRERIYSILRASLHHTPSSKSLVTGPCNRVLNFSSIQQVPPSIFLALQFLIGLLPAPVSRTVQSIANELSNSFVNAITKSLLLHPQIQSEPGPFLPSFPRTAPLRPSNPQHKRKQPPRHNLQQPRLYEGPAALPFVVPCDGVNRPVDPSLYLAMRAQSQHNCKKPRIITAFPCSFCEKPCETIAARKSHERHKHADQYKRREEQHHRHVHQRFFSPDKKRYCLHFCFCLFCFSMFLCLSWSR